MIPKDKVEAIVSKHTSIEKELSSGNIDSKKYAEKSKEYAELGGIIKNAVSFINFDSEKKDLENIINDKKSDKEMVNLAKKELSELLKKNEAAKMELKALLDRIDNIRDHGKN